MVKIMFVCHGNICRSPMAELVFKDMVQKAGRSNEFVIESSAVSDEEIYDGVGNPVYPPIAAILRAKGIDCSHKRAQKLLASDGGKYDLFVCMDDSNLRGAIRILGKEYADKCVKLMSFTGESRDVSDPWYTRDFNTCYEDIVLGLTAMYKKTTCLNL